jgi:hypothetical protein
MESALGVEGSLESLKSGGESSLESVAYHLVGVAAIGLYCVSKDGLLASKGCPHLSRVVLPACCTSLYIGEEESNCAGRRMEHTNVPSCSANTAAFNGKALALSLLA